jgi:AcrR family transcriptional regulator
LPTATYFNLPDDKRSRIFQAAVNEFAQRNIDAASLANIVAEAKISRGSIYQYFRDKEDLYIHVIESLREKRAEYAKPAFDLYKKEPFLTFFKNLSIRDSEFMSKHPQQLEVGKHLYGHAHGVSNKLIQKYQNHYREIFLIAIDYDMDRGIIRSDVNRAVLADLCVHLMTDVFIFQSLYDNLTIDDISRRTVEMMGIIENGIVP